jgi:hypothetical protein
MRTLLAVSLIILILVFTYLVHSPGTEDETYTDENQGSESGRPAHLAPGPVPDPAPEASMQSPDISAGPDKGAVRIIDMGSADDFNRAQEALEAIGVDELIKRNSQWRQSRGFAQTDPYGNLPYEQPYENFDDELLRVYAENGDMWAQQILADRIASSRPADALAWYDKAAQNGSIYAMKQMERLYSKISGTPASQSRSAELYSQQLPELHNSPDSPEQLSTAWAIVGQMAGADPSDNAAIKARIERNFSADEQASVCQTAELIYNNLLQARSSSGLGDYDREPPPFLSGTIQELSQLPCSDNYTGSTNTGTDFSSCHEIELISNGETQRAIECNQQQD